MSSNPHSSEYAFIWEAEDEHVSARKKCTCACVCVWLVESEPGQK